MWLRMFPHCLGYIRDVNERHRRAQQSYVDHRQITASYEGIAKPGSRELEQAQEFLGIPVRLLTTPTRKILESHRALVHNYNEVVDAVLERSLMTPSDLAESFPSASLAVFDRSV